MSLTKTLCDNDHWRTADGILMTAEILLRRPLPFDDSQLCTCWFVNHSKHRNTQWVKHRKESNGMWLSIRRVRTSEWIKHQQRLNTGLRINKGQTPECFWRQKSPSIQSRIGDLADSFWTRSSDEHNWNTIGKRQFTLIWMFFCKCCCLFWFLELGAGRDDEGDAEVS